MKNSRSSLRRRISAQRQSLDVDDQAEAELGVRAALAQQLSDSPHAFIAGYMAQRGEVDIEPALRILHDSGWTVVLPVCGEEGAMEFCPWHPGDVLIPGTYGIGEPVTEPVSPPRIDTFLVPGIAFDMSGQRVGHGAGYYDRFFARCFSTGHDPQRIGIAHDFQVEALPPPESWDVGMHLIITPSRVIQTKEQPRCT